MSQGWTKIEIIKITEESRQILGIEKLQAPFYLKIEQGNFEQNAIETQINPLFCVGNNDFDLKITVEKQISVGQRHIQFCAVDKQGRDKRISICLPMLENNLHLSLVPRKAIKIKHIPIQVVLEPLIFWNVATTIQIECDGLIIQNPGTLFGGKASFNYKMQDQHRVNLIEARMIGHNISILMSWFKSETTLPPKNEGPASRGYILFKNIVPDGIIPSNA